MKRYPVSLAAFIFVGCLGVTHFSYGQKANEHDGEEAGTGRAARAEVSVSEAFETLGSHLKEKENGTLVFKLEKEKETASVNLSQENIKSLNLLLVSVKEYADKMKACITKDPNDKVSVEFLSAINSFVNFINEKEILTKSDKQVNEKELNTLIVSIERAIADKATKFTKTKGEFEQSDKKVQESLIAIVKALQGGSWDKKIVDEDKLSKDTLLKTIKDAEETTKLCVLDPNAGTDSTATQTNGSLNNGTPAPPIVTADPSLGGGAINGGQPGGNQVPTQVPLNPATGFQNNQLQALQDALARANDDRERERELQDEILRRQFDERNRDSDQALAALQRALGQAQRPNVSRGNSDRSEQGPQLSPSVSIPQAQQQPFQQPQMPQLPPQQPLPLGQLMNNGPQPMMPYAPSRFNDDIPARPAVPAQPDPTTMALLQSMQQQNQMFQQMLMQRPYMGNGAPNVYGTNANMLQSMGRGAVQGGASNGGRPRVLPNRFRGSASGGVAGRIGGNPASRANLPSRLQR